MHTIYDHISLQTFFLIIQNGIDIRKDNYKFPKQSKRPKLSNKIFLETSQSIHL